MKRLAFALLSALAVGASGSAWAEAAQNWPTRTIRAILPFAPGTGADVVSRLVFNQISIQLGQQIVVENRGGAGGTIGAAAVAKADPDGYTILGQSTSHTIAPAIYPNMTYDVARDFAAVASYGRMPTALVIAPSKGFKTIQEFVTAAKAKPLTFASAGVGSTTHLTAERFRLSAGFEAIHVPFKGGGFRPEVASGRVDFAFSPIAVAVPDIRDGRLLALAVSGRERVSALPDVPTTIEAGYPNSDYVALVRPVRAGADAARHRGAAARRNHEGASGPKRARQAGRLRCRADAAQARRVRRLHQGRHRRPGRAGQGGGTQAQLNETDLANEK